MKFTEKFKKTTSAILAAALICAAAVPAFAAEQTDEEPETDIQTIVVPGDDIGEETDEEIQKAAEELYYDITNFELVNTDPGGSDFISWSNSTVNRYEGLKEVVSAKYENNYYSTMEEVNADREKLNEIFRTATVHKTELELMLDIFKKENNAAGYYDEEIWNEFTSVYEECRQAYEGDDEEAIHIAYVKARNVFNKLCLYNKTMGDVNNDGDVNVKDVTLLQKAVVEEVQLTFSQVFVCNYLEKINPTIVPDVRDVTELQKYVVEDESVTQFDSARVTDLEAYPEFELYPEDRVKEFGNRQGHKTNYVFYCYFNDQFYFWI